MSVEGAIAHYQGRCEQPWGTVKAKIASGEIRIGEPPLGPGEALVLLDQKRRYGVLLREL